MKTTILINSLDGGGAERVVTNLLNNLSSSCECNLILIENKILYNIDSRVNVICLNEKVYRSGIIKLIRLPIVAYKLSKIIKKNKFSQVTSFLYRANYINILSKYLANHRVVISERIAPSSMYMAKTIVSIVSKFLIRILYNKADLIISVSRAIEDDLINNFGIHIEQKVIYNPFDIGSILELSQSLVPQDIDREKSIITVGSLSARKNHELLVNAFSRINDKEFKLYILGKGDEEEKLRSLTNALNISDRVIFIGFDNNPYKYLSRCSIFVLASNSEGFPNVLLEAMICGCCVISTDCLSGPREILSPSSNIKFQLHNSIELAEYGILTPLNNIERMTNALNLLIEDRELKKRYIEKTPARSRDFNAKKITGYYKEILCTE